MAIVHTPCQAALEQWRELECSRFGGLCKSFACKPKPPSGTGPPPIIIIPPPPAPPPPVSCIGPECAPCVGVSCGTCDVGQYPPPCIGSDGIDPLTGCCQVQPLPPPAPAPPPPAPHTISPCVAPQHEPPCGTCEKPADPETGCCSGVLLSCAPGEHCPPCNPGDIPDLATGCCESANCCSICDKQGGVGPLNEPCSSPFAIGLLASCNANPFTAPCHGVPYVCGQPSPGC